MKQSQLHIEVRTSSKGLYECTDAVEAFVASSGVETGVLSLFCRHTSCSLIVQENADKDVQADLKAFFERIAPEGMDWIAQDKDGDNGVVPAHIRAALSQTSVSIPVTDGELVLGASQGIYVFEHVDALHRRDIVLHLVGEG